MNKIPLSVTFELNQSLTQSKLNDIDSFKNSLKSNERIRIGFGEGNAIVFSRYQESNVERGLRQIGNLLSKFKNSTAVNRNLILFNAKADHVNGQAPELLHI